jgi:hypothetical protein
LIKSRSFQTENSPELPRQRTQLRNELSSISKEFNVFLRNSPADSLSSIHDGKPSFPNSNNVRHESTRVSPAIHTSNFQSGFPERAIGNILQNQGPAQNNEVVRELQRLNSLLMNTGPLINSRDTLASGQISNVHDARHFDVGSDHQSVPDLFNQLSAAPHSSHTASQSRDVHHQPKIVLLRNQNSARPLNVQIGNTRLEVLGGTSGAASQLVIQTLKDGLGSQEVTRNNANSNVASVNQNAHGSTLLHNVIQSPKFPGTSPQPLIEQPLPAGARGPVQVKNIPVPLKTKTTDAPMLVATTPLTPSGALRQILGPSVPDTVFRKMAHDIFPSELRRLDAIMRGQIQVSNPISNNTSAGIIQIGNQSHALNLGNTKQIKILPNRTGSHAVVTSINTGGGPLKNSMVTEEPMEYDEILLRKVLQKMNG